MLRIRVPRRILLTSGAASIAVTDAPEKKLSIYPAPEPELLLVEDPSFLERKIRVARRAVTKSCNEAYSHVHGYVSRWIAIEHSIENRIKSILSPTERLTPGLLYVGVATLSGSIIARNRRLATRLLLPSSFFILTMHHFLPQTTHNISAYLNALEEQHFPTLAEKHRIGRAHAQMVTHNVTEWTKEGREQVGRRIESIANRVQAFTGLKVRDGLGWGKAIVARAKERVSGTAEAKAGDKHEETSRALEAKLP